MAFTLKPTLAQLKALGNEKLRARNIKLCIALLLAFATTDAGAQLPNTRLGFTIGLGVGGASVAADCDDCRSSSRQSYSFGTRLGFALSRHVVLSGESMVWNGFPIEEDFYGAVLLTVQWYPKAAGAFFLKTGVGHFDYDQFEDIYIVSASGTAAMIGVGFDWRRKRNFSLTPSLSFSTSGRINAVNEFGFFPDSRIRVGVLHLGIGFTWH